MFDAYKILIYENVPGVSDFKSTYVFKFELFYRDSSEGTLIIAELRVT